MTPGSRARAIQLESYISTLSTSTQHRLRHALAQWRHWQCEPPLQHAPEVLRTVPGGISNHSILVQSGARFIVRIDGINPVSHGLNRQLEWRALRLASSAGLAPTPRYFNPDLGCLVCDYLQPDLQPATCHEDTARLLRGIHSLQPLRQKLDLNERIARYEKHAQQIESDMRDALLAMGPGVRELARSAAQRCEALAVCHNDLLSANRLYSGGRLYALDWEYCAMADPLYDLAVIIVGDALEAPARRLLLEAYLQRPAEEAELLRLSRYACVYRYLELLWYLSAEQVALDEASAQHRLAQLARAVSEVTKT